MKKKIVNVVLFLAVLAGSHDPVCGAGRGQRYGL